MISGSAKETESAKYLLENILILADVEIRIDRVTSRDHTTEELVKQRISNQMPDNLKINLVDYIIENNNQKLLFPQVIKLDQLLRFYAYL